ncbi:unnamed protein product [Anisakis simplex]|uniref:PH-like domain-containing protein n=1 Tax=Anisakis simplex TaxID=6269 RepID=A0A3P6SHK6_ANISI|nr:unnamed protein product [Anisakis simplex]
MIDANTHSTDAGVHFIRIFFQLNYPPEIRKFQKKPADADDKFYSEGNRWRSIPEDNNDSRDNCAAINDSPTMCLQFTSELKDECLYEILSRIYMRVALPLEFTNVDVARFKTSDYVPMPVSYVGCDHRACAGEQLYTATSHRNGDNTDSEVTTAAATPSSNCNITTTGSGQTAASSSSSYEPPYPKVDLECYQKIVDCGVFGLEYLIAALMTRGAIVKDQLLISAQKRNEFVDLVVQRFHEDREVSESFLCANFLFHSSSFLVITPSQSGCSVLHLDGI